MHPVFRRLCTTLSGDVVIYQSPNPPLAVTAVLAALSLSPALGERFRHAAAGALLAWASLEIVRGVNPFRRLLGAVAACAAVAWLTLK